MKANRTNMLKRTAAAVLCAAFLLPAALPAAVYAADVPAEAQTGAEKTLVRRPRFSARVRKQSFGSV